MGATGGGPILGLLARSVRLVQKRIAGCQALLPGEALIATAMDAVVDRRTARTRVAGALLLGRLFLAAATRIDRVLKLLFGIVARSHVHKCSSAGGQCPKSKWWRNQ